MKKNSIFLITLILFGLAAITWVSLSWTGSEEAPAEVALLPAPYVHPVADTVSNWDEFIGRFAASERVEIRSKVNGYIESVHFKDGDIVEEGQVLFVIDQRPFRIALDQARAEKLGAEADLGRARSDYERIVSVQDSRAVSQEEADQRRQLAKAAEARLMAANARLAQAQLDLSYTRVRAPISGKISDDFIDQGNYISGGNNGATLLTTILKIDPIHFYFEGNEHDFSQTDSGSAPVRVKLAGEEGFTREGEMDFLDNEFDRSTGTIRGRAVFPNPDLTLQSGMFGRLQLIRADKPAILIPEEAIGTVQSQKIVYVIGQDSTINTVPVELGKLQDGKFRIVAKGLSVDDRVITGNLLKIRPGMKVLPQEKGFEIKPEPSALSAL